MDDVYKSAAQALDRANAVLIGASNGLSISEGFNLFADDEWFRANFGDFREKYGFHSVLQAASYQFEDDDARWGFWSRLVNLKTLNDPVSDAMRALRVLVGDRESFVVTTNAEGHFEPAGFPEESVFAMEGSFREMVCADRCTDEVTPSEEAVRAMAAVEADGVVPSGSQPRCAHCGAPMMINMAQDQAFFTTPHWKGERRAFEDFLARHRDDNVAVLVLGVGQRNPLVTGALMQARDVLSDTSLIVINKGGGTGIRPDGSVVIDDDITTALVAIEGNVKR